MDEEFSGTKYFILDENPIKTVWEAGIIIECYRTDNASDKLIRDDRLAYFASMELSHQHEISEHEFYQTRRIRAHEK